jgi:hypothetical protein
MSSSKKNIVIDLKNNYKEKNVLIENLKELIQSSVSNAEKIKSFSSIREKWIKIGKVPTHLSFGLNNSYKHHVKIFYDFLYLDKKIKKKDQDNNKKLMISLLNDAKRVKSYGDKLKSYRDLLILIKKWNFLTGPVKAVDEKKLNEEFDSIIQTIKNEKKDYLKNRDAHDEKNIQIKKELLENFKKLMNEDGNEKNEWIKKISEIEKIKNDFIGIGPIKSKLNNDLWKEFKILNLDFIKQKNLFFKNLKKTYSENIKLQLELIQQCKILKEKEKINISDLQNLKNDFKKIKNVPFKRNRENWNNFLNEYNQCFSKIDKVNEEKNKVEKEKINVKKNLVEQLKNDFSVEKISQVTQQWEKIGKTSKSNELSSLISIVKKESKKIGLSDKELEAHIIKIKSKLMNDGEKNNEKVKLRKKIDDLNKQISQLENNLNFIKKGSDSKVLDGVYSDIEKLKSQLQKNEKKYTLIK